MGYWEICERVLHLNRESAVVMQSGYCVAVILRGSGIVGNDSNECHSGRRWWAEANAIYAPAAVGGSYLCPDHAEKLFCREDVCGTYRIRTCANQQFAIQPRGRR